MSETLNTFNPESARITRERARELHIRYDAFGELATVVTWNVVTQLNRMSFDQETTVRFCLTRTQLPEDLMNSSTAGDAAATIAASQSASITNSELNVTYYEFDDLGAALAALSALTASEFASERAFNPTMRP
jgi:hypothetical protein